MAAVRDDVFLSKRRGALPLALKLPAAPLERLRLLLLMLAAVSAVAAGAEGAQAADSIAAGVGMALVAGALVAIWVGGYRRRDFPLWFEPLEVAALYVLLRSIPGDPFLPLFGLVFRSMYGSLPLVLARYGFWMATLVGAHAPRGESHVEEDLERVVGMVIAPGVMHILSGALSRLQANERRLRSLVQNSTDVVSVVGEDLLVRWQAESMRCVLGHEPARVLQTPVLELVHPHDRPILQQYFADAHDLPGHAATLSIRMRHADGEYRHVEAVAANWLHDESVRGHVLNIRDATDRLRLEAELRDLAARSEHDALHDALTGLANRRQLFAVLEEAFRRAQREGESIALLLVDLDHFKELNDTLGHHAGDLLLRELRPRLTSALAEADLVARIGGDEFAVLFVTGQTPASACEAGERLLAAVQQPFAYQGLTLVVRASVGIALYPDHAQDVQSLVQRADVAMYSAKAGGGGVEIYNASRDGHSRQRLALIGELPHAIERDQLVVRYQAQIDLQTGRTTGAEALVRWNHPDHGMLGPDAFLPMAEHIGLMRPLTLHVLDRALGDLAGWQRAGCDITVAVNLSAPNLIDLALPSDVSALLQKWKIEPHRLQIEVTETIIGADPVRVAGILAELRELGVIISLDDFGTGSSSLAYLRELPIDELKIDKSFVFAMDTDHQAAAIVRTIVELAHDLELKAVAEGVETVSGRDRLADYGCDYAQGYLFGRPVSSDEFLSTILETDTPTPAATPWQVLPFSVSGAGGVDSANDWTPK